MVKYIAAQCERSGMAVSKLDVDVEAAIFRPHTEGDRSGNRNQQRMDIVVRSWTWELHRQAKLPAPVEYATATGPVVLLIDVFYSDAMSHLNDVAFAALNEKDVLDSLCLKHRICEVDDACDKRSHRIKHHKYDGPIAEINRLRHRDAPPMVLLPLNFDVLGHASEKARLFLNALFRLEAHRSNTNTNFTSSACFDDHDPYSRTLSASQILHDSVMSKRWREVSTLTNKSTALHIINNASSVSYSLAAKAASAARFSSQSSSTTVVLGDDDDDDGNDHVSLYSSLTASLSLSAVSGASSDINENISQVDCNSPLAALRGMVGSGDES
jgi:hypothetical protein